MSEKRIFLQPVSHLPLRRLRTEITKYFYLTDLHFTLYMTDFAKYVQGDILSSSNVSLKGFYLHLILNNLLKVNCDFPKHPQMTFTWEPITAYNKQT